MNILDLMVYSTIRLDVAYGDIQGSGTGFFFSFCRSEKRMTPAIVTNKHVLDGATSLSILFHIRTDDDDNVLPTEVMTVSSSDILKIVARHPNPDVDLAVIPIGFLIDDQKKKAGVDLYFASMGIDVIPGDDEVYASILDIYMIGYPEGLSDEKNNFPLARRGITATPYKADFGGKSEFMIDCACFAGSSGSPIYHYVPGIGSTDDEASDHHFRLLGILHSGPMADTSGRIVRDTTDESDLEVLTRIPLNLGYCIKAKNLLFFEKLFTLAKQLD